MDKKRETHVSKFLSLILRHKPETVGVTLTADGWVEVDTLLKACAAHGETFTREELQQVVDNNDKKRFEILGVPESIRASQGHSLPVDLGYEEAVPPAVLFHGTAVRSLTSITAAGLLKMQRTHVHLSQTEATAWDVGARHGSPAILRVDARQMHADGFKFYKSANGVWLTDRVPASYIYGNFQDERIVRMDKRVDNLFIGEWSGGSQEIAIKMADGRSVRVTVSGFDKVDSDPIVDRLKSALPKIIAGT